MTDLRDLREAKGYDQGGLGLQVGVSKWTVHHWENGLISPNSGYIAPLSRALSVSQMDILEAIGEAQAWSGFKVPNE